MSKQIDIEMTPRSPPAFFSLFLRHSKCSVVLLPIFFTADDLTNDEEITRQSFFFFLFFFFYNNLQMMLLLYLLQTLFSCTLQIS